MNTVHGRHSQRGFLAFGLGVALFAVYGGIGAGVVASKDGEQQIAPTTESQTIAETASSGPLTRPRVRVHRDI